MSPRIRRTTIAGALPSQLYVNSLTLNKKFNCSRSKAPNGLDSLIEGEINQTSVSTSTKPSNECHRKNRDANFSLPNLTQSKSRLRDSMSNSLASQVLAAVQSCTTLNLPWSKVDRAWLPQLVWPHEIFTKEEQEEIDKQGTIAGETVYDL